jgi:glycosyltransferase involved in cell wall biosynthesis
MRPLSISMVGSRGIPATYSGIETALREICPRLVQRGHDVSVYTSSDVAYEGDFFEGVRIVRIPAISTKHLETLTRVMLSLWQEVHERNDIVHFHALGPALFSAFPRLLARRTVVTVHGLDWQRNKWNKFAAGVLRTGEFASARFPNATVVVSPVLKTYYDAKYGIDSVCIPNGVDLPVVRAPDLIVREYGLRKHGYLLFASRLVPEKGCHLLIEAFKTLETDKKLVIAGSSGHTDRYVAELRALASGNPNVLFTGFVSGQLLAELFSNAYLYVLPSEIEGLSVSLLEAMSYGLCVVTSDIPENVVVTEGDCGHSFHSGDSRDLAQRLSILLNDEPAVLSTGRKARLHVGTTYSWERVTDLTEAVYCSIFPGAG